MRERAAEERERKLVTAEESLTRRRKAIERQAAARAAEAQTTIRRVQEDRVYLHFEGWKADRDAWFRKESKERVRKYNEVRVPDAHVKYTKLGTTKQWRAKLTKRLAKRFDKLPDRLEAALKLNDQRQGAGQQEVVDVAEEIT
mgnify:CR=1 FL=1